MSYRADIIQRRRFCMGSASRALLHANMAKYLSLRVHHYLQVLAFTEGPSNQSKAKEKERRRRTSDRRKRRR
ncbi:Hypothetical protein NTJ_07776 [Nesidiocoris tenuis]|uniref:Uncharacterized protein n=1 Tax=Nesidiocoris tenuis TaxID=355587 RepID=A0ABN7AVR1_9HEMI|nr:Hypothetical protein NTJ_07776 [Nesidiocoris tenuis]